MKVETQENRACVHGSSVIPQALVVEIEKNQSKLDECQTHSKHYCCAVKVKSLSYLLSLAALDTNICLVLLLKHFLFVLIRTTNSSL